jgi:hypothetical protein
VASPLVLSEMENVYVTRPPKFNPAEDFGNWKNRMKSFYFFVDYTQWNSILVGPHRPMITGTDGVRPNLDPSTYTLEDRQLINRDFKAHGALQMALPADVNSRFEHCTTAQQLWNELCEFYDENEELKEGKRDLI